MDLTGLLTAAGLVPLLGLVPLALLISKVLVDAATTMRPLPGKYKPPLAAAIAWVMLIMLALISGAAFTPTLVSAAFIVAIVSSMGAVGLTEIQERAVTASNNRDLAVLVATQAEKINQLTNLLKSPPQPDEDAPADQDAPADRDAR